MPPIPGKTLQTYWQTTDKQTIRLYQGDVLEVLRKLPSQSVHQILTSPPYWGLRDYGTGQWEGGDLKCSHKRTAPVTGSTAGTITEGYCRPSKGSAARADHLEEPYLKPDGSCRRCGAKKIDRQLGSESSPDCLAWARGENCAEKDWATGCHVCRMVLVFREARRVLHDSGTLWMNYGDTYSGGGGYYPDAPSNWNGGSKESRQTGDSGAKPKGNKYRGLPSGNLVGVTWRVALALQADGWILRQDIIWAKPSPMPESVKNRCTKAHEYVFLFAKKSGYFYDAEAIKEKSDTASLPPRSLGNKQAITAYDGKISHNENHASAVLDRVADRNKRSVWTVASQGYVGAHFATFPPKLIEPMILAGTSEKGCCAKCKAPWRRVVETEQLKRERPNDYVKRTGEEGTGNSCSSSVAGISTRTIRWEPTCTCFGRFEKRTVTVVGQAINSARGPGGIPNGRAVGEGSHHPADYQTEDQAQDKAGQRAKASKVSGRERTVTESVYVPFIPLEEHPVFPCTVLDPFLGSGTTAIVSMEHKRRCVGIELSKDYLDRQAIPRIEGALMSRLETMALAGKTVEKVEGRSFLRKG